MYSIILILIIPFISEIISLFRKTKDDPVKRLFMELERSFPEDYKLEEN
jgi:hypothetical protein